MNSQYFSKEQLAAGEVNEFLNLLIKQSYGKGDCYNDIHVVPCDLGAVMVEWESNPWSGEYGGKWKYVQEDDEEVVAKYYYFPDESSVLCESEEVFNDYLKDWLEEHKEEDWAKNEYGKWYSKKQQRDWEEELKRETLDD